MIKTLSNWTKKTVSTENRSMTLDAYRGTAVLLMIIFHLCWDLRDFGYLSYSLNDLFWINFRGIIMTLFISAVGWSAYLSYKDGIKWRNLFIRQSKLLLCTAAISIGTYLAFPNNWVFFGILHFILLAGFIILPVVRRPWVSLLLGTALLALFFFNDSVNSFNFHHYLTTNFSLPTYTLDLVNISPWISVIFLGPILGYLNLHKLPLPQHVLVTVLAFLGRHALLVYLSHQLLLYTVVFFIHSVMSVF